MHVSLRLILASVVAWLFTAASCFAAEPVALSDEQLRAQIVGIWYTEELPQITSHVGQRTEYRADWRFIADYRISGPGSERFIRAIGTWSFNHGVFSETATKTSDPKIKFPTFKRHVLAIDAEHMVLVSLDETHQSEQWRGKRPPGTGNLTTKICDRKELLADLMTMHVGGYHSDPAGNGAVRFILDSRKLQEAPKP